MQNTKEHPFAADRPIKTLEADLLGRSNFAISVANAIAGWKGQDSLVVALYGAWGSGKTSIKNMMVESLRLRTKSATTIVEFNPWQWAGQEQVASAFFSQIGIHLGRTEPGKTAKKLAMSWRLYASYLKVSSSIFEGVKNGATGLLGLSGAAWVGNLLLTSYLGSLPYIQYVGYILGIIVILSGLTVAILNWGGKLSESIAGVFYVSSELKKKDLQEIKTDLGLLLQNLEAPILVIIDDIDRLPPQEIRLLFQLVKANADMPNIVYLLLFQRDIVENALTIPNVIEGNDYLEKIVQVSFDVPRIEQQKVEHTLFAGIDKLLENNITNHNFNQRRWGNIFAPGLRPFFNNLRDVHRYLNTLSFHFSLFRGGVFEVNPIDLIALEVLRVFEPEVYHAIAANKETLTSIRELGFRDEGQIRANVDDIIHRASEERQICVREIIKQLFPPIEWVMGGSGYGSDFRDRWYRSLRVCHPDIFDRYFLLATPEGDISHEQIQKVLALIGDHQRLVAEFRRLESANLLGVLLDRLEAYKEKLDLADALPFITALFDIGDTLQFGVGFSGIGPEMNAVRIIFWYLKRELDVDKRTDILCNAMSASTGLYLPVRVTSLESKENEKNYEQYNFLVEENGYEMLKAICLEKIRRAAMTGELASQKHIGYIVYRWREWSSPVEPQTWVEKFVTTKEGLLLFLKFMVKVSRIYGSGDYVARTHRYYQLKSIEDFIKVDDLSTLVNNIDVDSLNNDDQQLIIAFQRAIQRHEEGKPDDDGWRIEDEDD